MKTTYTLHSDGGHGWLEVKRSELTSLGIESDISSCSYQSRDGATCYLEEDCDLSVFARAKGWTQGGGSAPIVDKYHTDNRIRGLDSFKPRNAQIKSAIEAKITARFPNAIKSGKVEIIII